MRVYQLRHLGGTNEILADNSVAPLHTRARSRAFFPSREPRPDTAEAAAPTSFASRTEARRMADDSEAAVCASTARGIRSALSRQKASTGATQDAPVSTI